jgi:hypothetical protein
MTQTKIGFSIDILKAEKNGSSTKLKGKEHRQVVLSNWVIFGSEAERLMKKFTQGDFFENVLDKGGNTNHIYVFLKGSLQWINFTDRKATISQQILVDWKDQAHEGAA